jgi:uncharacterized membrane protein HdeD (DUF308 family)
MKTVTIAGIILVVLAIISFANQGITYTTQKKVADVGPVHATVDEKHHIPFRPVLGCILLVGGVILIVTGFKEAKQ